MDFLNRIASLSVIFAALVLFIICQTSTARSISYLQSAENPLEISESYIGIPQNNNQQQQQIPQQQADDQQQEEALHLLSKRRLVVRVPFAQSPDSIQLHRLYKTLFNTKEKKQFMSLQALL